MWIIQVPMSLILMNLDVPHFNFFHLLKLLKGHCLYFFFFFFFFFILLSMFSLWFNIVPRYWKSSTISIVSLLFLFFFFE